MTLKGKLVIVEGFVRDKTYTLPHEGDFQIGRDRRCDICIMSRRVSRLHAKITAHKNTYSISDLESKTGTLVNNRKILKSILRPNDLIQVGDLKMRFTLHDEQRAEETPVSQAPLSAKPVITPPKPAPTEPPTSILGNPESPDFSDEESAIISKVIGGIKIIAALSRGRRTLVYKGIQSERNRIVAFKIVLPNFMGDADVKRWFVQGARSAGEFHHENILAPLGGGFENGLLFLFTPFMENGNAQQRFDNAKAEGIASIKRALESLVHVSRALEFGQTKGIYHIGIRPSKLLYDENRQAKLNGLGFDNSTNAPSALKTSEVLAYLAPEQLNGGNSPTSATDIFSLGVTFYYMLTGQRPSRDLRGRLSSPKQINEIVPDSLCRITEKMTAVQAEQRYKTYGQLLHDLRWALRGESWPHT